MRLPPRGTGACWYWAENSIDPGLNLTTAKQRWRKQQRLRVRAIAAPEQTSRHVKFSSTEDRASTILAVRQTGPV
jgi:hypothetical protein